MGLLGGALCLLSGASPAHACELEIVWKADLSGSRLTPPLQTPATGTAAIKFDFVHPGAMVQVDTKNLRDARAVEVHVSRSYSDHAGPTVLTLYSAANGPLPVALTKRVTDADIQKQASLKIGTLADLVQAVLNDRAYVLVTTQAHPEGELSGFITMHKEAVYTDTPGDIAHDPTLRHAAQTKPL